MTPQTSLTYELVLKGGRILDPGSGLDQVGDVGISGGKIVQISGDLDARSAEQTVDVSGKIVAPGLIDLHTHVAGGLGRITDEAAFASADHKMGHLLQRYENAGQDAHEEALVILVASGARVACPEVKKAAQLLRLSAGWNPLNLLRALCWLPMIVWTRHYTPGTPFS